MSTENKTQTLIKQLGSPDEKERQDAQNILLDMGDDVLYDLNDVLRESDRYPIIEVYRLIGLIGDNCGDRWKRYVTTVMKQGAESAKTTETAEAVRQIARESLIRWGQDLPQPKKIKVNHCHICNRPSTEVELHQCTLPDCHNYVCEKHGLTIEGDSATWFCSEEHKQYVLDNPLPNEADAITFINKINEDQVLQERIKQLQKGDWQGFFLIAKESGLYIDHKSFLGACLSSSVNHFCPALTKFAGQLHSYKM